MKAFLALTFLAALSLAAGVDLKILKPRDIVMPVNPRHTWQEWQEIYAAQVPSPQYNTNYKKGTEPQPEFAGKVHVSLKEQSNRITGGSPAVRGQVPWMAAIVIDNAWFCGGSLISNRWVLTAAHCAGNSYQIVLGANRNDGSESGALTVVSTSSIVHSQYDPNTLNNDIAVVRLPSAVTFTTYISPIRLRNIPGFIPGARVFACGWGRTSDSSNTVSPTLNCVELTVITNTECAPFYGSFITATKLCVATSGGQSPCNGDSGGPVFFLESDGIYTLVGIVSFGAAAGCTLGYPFVITRISSYLDWISSNTGILIG